MFKFFKYLYFGLALTIFLGACSNSYQKVLNSADNEYKFEMAKSYFNNSDYFKALPIFEELLNVHKGTDKAEKIYFYYAYCHYGQSDYLIAAYHFKNFAITYPSSKYAEESQYLFAYCHYLMSPKASLDQTNTHKAIEAFKLFVTLFPKSEKIPECNAYIDELRIVLQQKDFEAARLYLKLEYYEAAKLSFENLLIDYPDFRNKEEASFLAIKSYYLYALGSIQEKQKERFTFVKGMYQKFIGKYPSSAFTKDLKNINANCNRNLNKLNI